MNIPTAAETNIISNQKILAAILLKIQQSSNNGCFQTKIEVSRSHTVDKIKDMLVEKGFNVSFLITDAYSAIMTIRW